MEQTNNTVAVVSNKPADIVLKQFDELVNKGSLQFPADYNYGNAVKYAALIISQNPLLNGCTSASIVQAISDMALQGLEANKKQVYFIKYGNELKCFRSYFGDVAAAIRTGLVKDVKAVVIYDGDDFETDIVDDEECVTLHKTKFENRDNGIKGAYAVAVLPSGKKRYCIMTKKEIEKNWAKSTNKNNQVQQDFPQEMAKRTVIRRLVKLLFNSSNTADNFSSGVVEAFNRTTEQEYDNPVAQAPKKSSSFIPKVAQEELDYSEETSSDNGVIEEEVETKN